MRFQFRNSCESIVEEHGDAIEYTQVTDAFLSSLSGNDTMTPRYLVAMTPRYSEHRIMSCAKQLLLRYNRCWRDQNRTLHLVKEVPGLSVSGCSTGHVPMCFHKSSSKDSTGAPAAIMPRFMARQTSFWRLQRDWLVVVTRVCTLLKIRVIQHPKLTPNRTVPEYNTYLHAEWR